MLSIKKVKELLEDKNISDEEAEKIRDACYEFVELALDKYLSDKKTTEQQLYFVKSNDDVILFWLTIDRQTMGLEF